MVTVRPSSDITVGGWTNESGGATLYTSLNDASQNDATFIRSSDNPVADTAEVHLGSSGVLADGTLKIAVGKGLNNAVEVNQRIALVQGTTEKAVWTYNDVAFGITLKTETLTGPQLASISDFTDLRIRMMADVGVGGGGFSSGFSTGFEVGTSSGFSSGFSMGFES